MMVVVADLITPMTSTIIKVYSLYEWPINTFCLNSPFLKAGFICRKSQLLHRNQSVEAPSAEQKIINFLFAPLQLLLICFAPNSYNGSKEGWFSIVPRIIWHLIFVLMSDNSARHVQVRSTKMSTIRIHKHYFKLDLYIYLTNEIKMLQCINGHFSIKFFIPF